MHHDRSCAHARGADAAEGSAERLRRPPALQARGARADRGADRAVPGSSDRADLHGVHVSARGRPGGTVRQGESEPEGPGPERRAQETELGRQRQVAGQLPSGPRDDDSQLEWMQKLGDAVLAQQKDTMDAIQRLRTKAQSAGNLKTTEQQKVIVEQAEGQPQQQTVIRIEPASPDVIYVPTYNPTVVYGGWP